MRSYTEYVEVIVGTGSQQKQFMVHKQLLTERSLFFKKALSGNWIEAKERKVKLPEDDHEAFHVYVNLLYTDQISPVPASQPGDLDPVTTATNEHVRYVNLYILADKLQDVETQNKALAALLTASLEIRSDQRRYIPGIPAIPKAYAYTTPGSMLRKMIVDIWTKYGNVGCLKPDMDYPMAFLRECLASVLEKRVCNTDLADPLTLLPG
jgi:hypothetical protein